MTGARSRTVQRPLAALFAAACLIAVGCESAVVPLPPVTAPTGPHSSDPSASGGPPGTPAGTDSGAPSATVAPSPQLGLPQPTALAMPGFAAYDQVQMIGSEYAATAYTALSCDALAGWLQAADWRLDGSFTGPLPSTAPAAGEVVPPRTRWLVISRPGEAAVAKLVSDGNTGCRASVGRLSQQPLSASGTFATTTTAMAYQMICLPEPLSVTAGAFYIGDDGTRAMISAKVPLVLGEQQLLDADMWIGAIDFTPADLAESFAASLGTLAFIGRLDGMEPYEGVYQVSTGTATVTSIDPFVATITLGGFVSEAGATQSVSAGIRCDLPGHQLERAAIAPPGWSPAPTVSAAGSMSLTIGSSISENLAGPAISCWVGFTGADHWVLSYSDPELEISLSISPDLGVLLEYIDSRTEIPTWIAIGDAPNSGHLDATVSDRGSEVDFTATGVTEDGEEVALSATCTAIERA